ncbi:potassium channel family protein [Paraburkholderia elongata]|uniref:Two pore domain potassium channel family protein n=1 Tax=Paraburkholderia elongata TaxID=2675747 RepID=A0A972NP13_9BURK|nr:potassium channel family protein [Paraburkholderia elongata]NPT55793.1 two pore domain potassium channel family protein [Paraburkholderia elongata]
MEENARNSSQAPLKAGHVFEEFARTLWQLRAPLAVLLVLFLLLSTVMYYVGGLVESASRAPSSFGQTLYFCMVTALTIGYGDVVPTTTLGRIDSVLLGMQGVLVTSMVTAAFVHAVQETARRAGRQGEAQVSPKPPTHP